MENNQATECIFIVTEDELNKESARSKKNHKKKKNKANKNVGKYPGSSSIEI